MIERVAFIGAGSTSWSPTIALATSSSVAPQRSRNITSAWQTCARVSDPANRFAPQSNKATKQRQQGSFVGLLIFILVGGIIGICGVWLLLLTIGALA